MIYFLGCQRYFRERTGAARYALALSMRLNPMNTRSWQHILARASPQNETGSLRRALPGHDLRQATHGCRRNEGKCLLGFSPSTVPKPQSFGTVWWRARSSAPSVTVPASTTGEVLKRNGGVEALRTLAQTFGALRTP